MCGMFGDMSDPQQPGEGAQAPEDPSATPPFTPEQGQTAPPRAPYQRPSSGGPFAAAVPPQAGSEADDPTPGAYTPPSYQPGQASGALPVPSSPPRPPAGSLPEGPLAPGYGGYPALGQGVPTHALGCPGSAQLDGPGYPGQPGPPTQGGGGGNGLAIAAVVGGGVALLFSWVYVLGLLLALAGLGLGVVALARGAGSRALAWVGTGLSIHATLIAIVVLLVTRLVVGEMDRQIDEGPRRAAPWRRARDVASDDSATG